MTSVANLQPEPAPIVACTISRDVQNFDMLIDDMESELGEAWGDLSFDDALIFLGQPDASTLEFVAIAVNGEDEADLSRITDTIRLAKGRNIRVVLIADQVSPIALHQMLRLGADDFVPYPLPEGALHEAIERMRKPAPSVALAAVPNLAALPFNPSAEPEGPRPAFKAKGDRDAVVLPVHGLAGGTGASTFATNLAWELAMPALSVIAKQIATLRSIRCIKVVRNTASHMRFSKHRFQDKSHRSVDLVRQALLV